MDEQEFDIRGALGLLRRQFRLIAVTVLLILAVAGGAIVVLKPVYTATTLILVDPSRKDLLDPDAQAQSTSSDGARVESEVELVKSEDTLVRVVGELDLVHDRELGVRLGFTDMLLAFLRIAEPRAPTGQTALQDVLTNLRDAISVQRRGLTYLIAVQARSFDPARAAELANAVSNAYIQEQLEAKVNSTLASRDIIERRIEDARRQLEESEGAFDSYIADNIDQIARDTGRSDLATLREQLQQVNDERLRVASIADLVGGSLDRRDWTAVARELESEALAALESQRRELLGRLAGAPQGSQAAIDLDAELEALEAEMLAATRDELGSLRRQVTEAQALTTDLRLQLRTGVLESDMPPTLLTSIYSLQQNAELARTQYQTMLTRLRDLETQATLQVADSRIASEARPPAEPSFPNPRLILSLAGVAALGLGIGLAFLVENFIGGFTSEEQLQSVLRPTAVASTPRQKSGKGPMGGEVVGVADLVVESPLSAFAESIRRLRMGIDQILKRAPAPKSGVVVMVTSAAPNEGKTTLALSLARNYALAGRSTLLIDCDMRKPSIHQHLGLEPSSGLLDYLADNKGPSELASVMTVDVPSGAQVIIGARRSDIATDQLVTGAPFNRLINAARDNFDIVILDTPPIGPVVDGLYLAQFANVVVYVVRWANTSQQDAKSGFNALMEALPPETGVLAVLNQEDRSRASYRYAYSQYYVEK